ncbi:hypothetical protein GCM10009677_23820 [Sphaerisporangium rubeum]
MTADPPVQRTPGAELALCARRRGTQESSGILEGRRLMAPRTRAGKLLTTAALIAAGITFSVPVHAVADHIAGGKRGQVTVAGYTWSN